MEVGIDFRSLWPENGQNPACLVQAAVARTEQATAGFVGESQREFALQFQTECQNFAQRRPSGGPVRPELSAQATADALACLLCPP